MSRSGAPVPRHPWVAGTRPRTLPASAVPVVVGTAVAGAEGHVIWWRAAAALVVAVAIQVGTNYANDYSDGVRGTDERRVGPVRLVASGLASPSAVRRAAVIAFGVAALAGLALAAAAGWWLILVGAASVAAGWLYTGGPRPYGYAGLGELFVFVFFGLVATVGTAYVQLERITGLAVAASVPVGLLAVALLVVNNLREHTGRHRQRQAHSGRSGRRPGDPPYVRRLRPGAVRARSGPGRVPAWGSPRPGGAAPGRRPGPVRTWWRGGPGPHPGSRSDGPAAAGVRRPARPRDLDLSRGALGALEKGF